MPKTLTCDVVVEADAEGQFIRLPEGWLIEPIGSDVVITRIAESGKYLVEPVIGEDGLPNCTFIFPAAEV